MGERPSFFTLEREHREKLNRRTRLPYAAVPLDPYHATYPFSAEEMADKKKDKTKVPYVPASMRHIEERFHKNFMWAIENDRLIGDPEILRKLGEMALISLFNAQIERIEHHAHHPIHRFHRDRSTRMRAAKMGLAIPEESLEIFANDPKIPSLELAKFSHPFKPEATAEMDQDVMGMLGRIGLHAPITRPRAKVKRYTDIPAAIVVHKEPIGTIELPDGVAEVIRRKGVQIRGDEVINHMTPLPIDRLVRNPGRQAELLDLVNTTSIARQTPPWEVALNTAYYVHRPDLAA